MVEYNTYKYQQNLFGVTLVPKTFEYVGSLVYSFVVVVKDVTITNV